ncbi:MAG: hypothetical protein AAFQ82_12155 [Myxococcota bacterium]
MLLMSSGGTSPEQFILMHDTVLDYLLFTHRGARCAVLAEEIAAVYERLGEHSEIEIWTDSGAQDGGHRYLQPVGVEEVVCSSDVRTVRCPELSFAQLPRLVRDALPGCVIGMVDIDGEAHWVLRLAKP